MSISLLPLMTPIGDCWNRIGVNGDRTCPALEEHVHCRNCPVFAGAARGSSTARPPTGYLAEWAELLGRPVEAGFGRRLGLAGLPARRRVARPGALGRRRGDRPPAGPPGSAPDQSGLRRPGQPPGAVAAVRLAPRPARRRPAPTRRRPLAESPAGRDPQRVPRPGPSRPRRSPASTGSPATGSRRSPRPWPTRSAASAGPSSPGATGGASTSWTSRGSSKAPEPEDEQSAGRLNRMYFRGKYYFDSPADPCLIRYPRLLFRWPRIPMSDDLSGFSLMDLFRSEADGQVALLTEGCSPWRGRRSPRPRRSSR